MFIIVLISLILNIILINAVTFDPNYHLGLVNNVRAQNGKNPLVLSPCLQLAAQYHSNYQKSITTMTHDSPLGGLFARMQAFGAASMSSAAENVASGYSSDDAVVAGWVASSGHFANIIGNYQYFGVGMATTSSGTPYWTQQFANYQTCNPTSPTTTTSNPSTTTTTTVPSTTSTTGSQSTTTTGTPTTSSTTATTTSPSTTTTTGTPSGPNLSVVSQHLSLINAFRAQNGKAPLTLCSKLVQASLSHSQYQASISSMTNANPAGGIIARMKAAGVVSVSSASQNVAAGYNTDASAVTGLTASSTKNNILGNYQYFGVAMVKSSANYPYWTQMFMSGSC
ncbi:hypothetical protein DFA_01127 [Cavenderia fasciculata]|uniref:SCP domain-containing protein n=1 Tax=Cavenderia fasciculata TaxID=261658 RepID=F4PQY4_CACFS|nr:uncharacterized protein DFA_01127 [Cavenderia fasciculata]EGG21249.1 hypothetical protein DFA_01127 [Cavenderia fasciculata]|eukprot:XP_004359099.1 hypothetical protein DFA_01127 [Cavenderia fasciculata]